jgi:hypothetical protein
MSIKEKRRMLFYLNSLLRSKTKGTVKEIACRLCMSESNLLAILDQLRKELNAPLVDENKVCPYVCLRPSLAHHIQCTQDHCPFQKKKKMEDL